MQSRYNLLALEARSSQYTPGNLPHGGGLEFVS